MEELIIKRGIPLPQDRNNKLSDKICCMEDGDCMDISYTSFTKSHIGSSIASGRVRMKPKNLRLITRQIEGGMRIWIYKDPSLIKKRKKLIQI